MNIVSEPQQQIVDLVRQGITDINDIAAKLFKTRGIIRAQITRIQNAGHGNLVTSVKDTPTSESRPSGQPMNVGKGSSNQAVLSEAQKAGTAVYDIPDALLDAVNSPDTDVHPMVLLGVTIQYVKLVGGRLSAHQLIEQVYDALRAMVSDGSPKVGQEQWSAPWPLNSVEMENNQLKARIAELERTNKKVVSGSDDA